MSTDIIEADYEAHDALDTDGRELPAPTTGRTMQRVGGQYATAVSVQRPRELKTVLHRLTQEATLAGEDFFYGWGAGKDRIEGPSVELAMAAARNWGNCVVEPSDVQDLPDAWIISVAFVDLETGFTITRQFRQAKNWTVHGKLDPARKEDIRFQIGQSKAARNVILKALPKSLIDRAMSAAKSGVRAALEKAIDAIESKEGKGRGLAAITDRALKALTKYGVKEEAVLEKLGIVERKGVTVDHLVILKANVAALERGEARPEELFPPVAGDKVNGLADRLTKAKEPKPEPAAEPQARPEPQPIDTADSVFELAQRWAADEGRNPSDLLFRLLGEMCPDASSLDDLEPADLKRVATAIRAKLTRMPD